MKFKNEHSLVMILIKKYILIFCILCFSVNVHARNKSYNLGTEFTVSILKEDPDGVFDFIEDKIKLLSQNLVPLMYTKDFCLTSRSCRTEIDKYEFLKWDCELGDCVMFDIRTLHGTLNPSLPKKTLSRYTLRVAKEDTKIDYVGDWTSYNYRKAMQDAGYKNGDKLGGTMFPQLWPRSI